MNNSLNMPIPDPRLLCSAGEYYGAGWCEMPDVAPIERHARAWRRWLERTPLAAYAGGGLYPHGPQEMGTARMYPSYSYTYDWDLAGLESKAAAATPPVSQALRRLTDLLLKEAPAHPAGNSRHTIGGSAYTHSIINYDRVLAEGLDGYQRRINIELQRSAPDEDTQAFYRAMTDMIAGIRAWHARVMAMLESIPSPASGRDRLLNALQRVPWRPASTFYEAMVAYNILFYLDGCDNPGRMDQALLPYYRDPADTEDAQALISEFADNVSACAGWSAALGGTTPDGRAAYNALTEIILRATRGRYRPSLELRVRDDMPHAVWQAAFDALESGNGQPAFYNEAAYLQGLRSADLGIAERDLALWNGGGCTETMLHGCSNVGSLDAGFNLPLVLSESLARSLRDGTSFETVLEDFKSDLRSEILATLGALNDHLLERARRRPQPMRSLLIDDCIERGRDFNSGGARYNWSVVNVAGLANVADSLAALQIAVFQRREVTPEEMREALESNFKGREPLRRRLAACPKFGNDEPSVDQLAADIADYTYRTISGYPCARGGKFLPSHIMFEVFAVAGQTVGALPDGRLAGEPLADSVGPVQGRDRKGPTAMLRSVARLPLERAIGTPVLNMRFAKSTVSSPRARPRLRALIEGFFAMGGLQVQFSLLDRQELEDALKHPERHEDLIVRVGGYSAYFNRLSPELQREVIKRTEYFLSPT